MRVYKLFAAVVIALSVTSSAQGQTPGQEPADAVGKWHVKDLVSALEGTHTLYATLDAETPVIDSVGYGVRPSLTLSCGKGGLVASVVWPTPDMGMFGHVDMKWKLDDGPIQKASWAGGTISGEDAQKWIRGLSAAKRLVVQVKTSGVPQETTFDLTGADVVGPKFSEATCH